MSASRPAPVPAARRAPAWLDDAAIESLLATPLAGEAIRDLHGRPELPSAARSALGGDDRRMVEWLREAPSVALAPRRTRELSRHEGDFWPTLCLVVAQARGQDPLAIGGSRQAITGAIRSAGDPEGRLWLGLLHDAEPGLLRPLLPGRARRRRSRRVWWRQALAGLVHATSAGRR